MADEPAFLAAIWENPHDDTARLVYADWLEEHGRPERAEFIRVQCEAARLDEDEPRREELARRERELLTAHRTAWTADLPHALRDDPFHRGFVRPVRKARATVLIRGPARTWDAVPLWKVRITGYNPAALLELFGRRAFARVGSLDVSTDPNRVITTDELRRLIRSPFAVNLAVLNCSGNPLDPDVAEELFSPGCLPALESLDLGNCRLRQAGWVRPLLESARVAALRKFMLAGNDLGSDALDPLFAVADRFTRLDRLDLSWNQMGAATVHRLAAGPVFPSLREFALAYPDDPKDTATVALAGWPGLANLRVLRIGGYPGMGPIGARALAASPYLAHLRELHYAKAYAGWKETNHVLREGFGPAYRE